MNPQTSPWTLLADRQRYNDFKRQQQEKQLKNYIRLNYQKQLTEQLNQQKEMKLKEKQKEKQWEKNLINSSIENQQRIIEMEKMKNYAANQKQSRLDYENQYLKAARKQRQDFLEGQTKKVQNQMHKIAEQKLRKQQMQEDLKKKMVLETLKESMDTKKAIQRYKKEQQQQFQSHKLHEGDMLHQREQQYREDYLRKLKEKAATIDYGSHEAFTKNHYKTLVQRKKQEWQSEQQYRRRAEQLNSYEEQYKKLKQGVEDGYRSQLKKQMNQREYNRKQSHRREISNDLDNMMRYQTISKSVDLHKKEIEDRHKKQLLDYLKKQVDYKNNLPKQPYFMRDNEILLNYNLLQNSKGIIPGQTYELDHARKKQLQTVAKSIVNSPKLDSNYLAGRGKTILN